MNRSHVIDPETKSRGATPRNAMALDTLAGVRSEMSRRYRLALNGRIRSDETTRFIYALKEIRARLEAELLTDVQQCDWPFCRETWKTTMVNASFINRLSNAVDLIEKRSQQNSPLKVATVQARADPRPKQDTTRS